MAEGKKELIYEKILAIMADIKVIGKKRQNVAQGYSFRGVDDVYNELHDIFVKHRVFTVPAVLDTHHEERTSKKGSALIYRIYKVKYTFYAEDGSSIEAIIVGEGMDTGDKAGNKALSVAHKYVLLQMLLIPTDESKDPEDESHQINKPKPKPEPEDDGIADMASQPDVKSEFRTISLTIGKKTIMHTKYEALDRFKKAKDQLGKELYYKILGENGYEKSNEIPNKDIPKLYDAMAEAYKQEKKAGKTKVADQEKPTQGELTELARLETTLIDKHGFSPNQIINQFKETVDESLISNMTKEQVVEMTNFFKDRITELNEAAKE